MKTCRYHNALKINIKNIIYINLYQDNQKEGKKSTVLNQLQHVIDSIDKSKGL